MTLCKYQNQYETQNAEIPAGSRSILTTNAALSRIFQALSEKDAENSSKLRKCMKNYHQYLKTLKN